MVVVVVEEASMSHMFQGEYRQTDREEDKTDSHEPSKVPTYLGRPREELSP